MRPTTYWTRKEQLRELDRIQSALDGLGGLFEARIARSDYEDKVLKQYSDEVQEHRKGLYRKIMLPLVREIIGMREQMRSVIVSAYARNERDPAVPARTLSAFAEMFADLLEDFDIELFEPAVGEEFRPGVERPCGKVATGDESRHGHIAEVGSDAYLMDGKVVVPAQVKVYVFDQKLCRGLADAQGDALETSR